MKELLKKKSIKIGLLIIILLVAAVIIGINVQSAQRQKEYDNHIKAAEKYLTELDYEQAIAEYTLAYEIEPNEEVLDALEQTYLAYAQSYVDTGDYESAISILEEGYAQIGRESLRERIEELQSEMEKMQAEMEAEQRRQQEEEEKVALKELVESEEYQENLWKLSWESARVGWIQHISDEKLKELSRLYIDTLERYRELYEENYSYWYRLSELYLISDEYELSIERNREVNELRPNGGNDLTEVHYDKYGRFYWREFTSGTDSREYGDNEKLVKRISTVDNLTSTTIYEYDAEGRTVRTVQTDSDGSVHDTTFVYNQTGFTEYHNSSWQTSSSSVAIDCKFINEFGEYISGEPYDIE